MKILDTNKKFYNEIKLTVKKKPSYFYVATFNINVDDQLLWLFYNLPKNSEAKLIIGIQEASEKQIAFINSKLGFMNPKIFRDSHLKLIVSDKGCIVGGRNLTQSEWDDISVLLVDKNTEKELKIKFLNFYKKTAIN